MCNEPEENEEEVIEFDIEPEKQTPNVITLNKGHGGIEITIQSSDSDIYDLEQILEILMKKYGGYSEVS